MRKSLMRMTFRQLQIFRAVCESRSYSRAAEEMALTQPAVSLQIRQLEELLGQPLFDYVAKKLYLTPAAEALLRASEDVFGRLEALDMQLSDLQGSLQGQLSLESQLGAGTRAAFFLQLRQVPGSATFEPEAAPATTAGQRGPAARALPALSPQQKQDLEALAVQGNWSDLHAWLDALSRDGHFQQLVQAVLPALERLDFEQIRQIARAAPTKPN